MNSGAHLDLWLGDFLAPPLTFLGGGQEKCVLYLNNKKLTLPIPDKSIHMSDMK